jgi:hypothetical protein
VHPVHFADVELRPAESAQLVPSREGGEHPGGNGIAASGPLERWLDNQDASK